MTRSLNTHSKPITSPKIALIGCGAISESYYLPALAKYPSVMEKLILVDHDRARARELAGKFNVSRYRYDYREVLKEVNGVIVALPTHLHHPISMEFLSHGVHVLCEKPLAESANKAREIVEYARETGAALSVNYLQRLIPTFAEVKRLLANKLLCEPLSLEYLVGEKFTWPTVSGFYFKSSTSARGVLRDRGAHVIDHICWWFGRKPHLISSHNDSFGGSEAVAEVRFMHGKCTGTVKLNWLSSFPCKFRIECEEGVVEGDVYGYQSLLVSTNSGRQKRVKFKSISKSDIGDRMTTNFIDVISKGEKPLVSGSDVLDSIQFIDECYEAATRFDMPWYKALEVENVS